MPDVLVCIKHINLQGEPEQSVFRIGYDRGQLCIKYGEKVDGKHLNGLRPITVPTTEELPPDMFVLACSDEIRDLLLYHNAIEPAGFYANVAVLEPGHPVSLPVYAWLGDLPTEDQDMPIIHFIPKYGAAKPIKPIAKGMDKVSLDKVADEIKKISLNSVYGMTALNSDTDTANDWKVTFEDYANNMYKKWVQIAPRDAGNTKA